MSCGVKVFSVTRPNDRQGLGAVITDWLASHPHFDIVDKVVVQSSDRDYHCLSVILFFEDTNARQLQPREESTDHRRQDPGR